MTEVGMNEPSPDQFKSMYDLVSENSNRSRYIIYVFMVVNFALFIAVFGADIYRRPIERLKDFRDAVICYKLKKSEADSHQDQQVELWRSHKRFYL